MSWVSVIGIIGMLVILAAFALNLFKIITQDKITYCVLNILGSTLLGINAYFINSIPFLILQIVWILFSAYKIIIIFQKIEKAHHKHVKKIDRRHA
jgi:hypothetical protein